MNTLLLSQTHLLPHIWSHSLTRNGTDGSVCYIQRVRVSQYMTNKRAKPITQKVSEPDPKLFSQLRGSSVHKRKRHRPLSTSRNSW